MVDIFYKSKYPHMLPNETAIWDRFLALHGSGYQSFDYDVHVGDLVTAPAATPEYLTPMLEAVYRKRIDAVGYCEDVIWLFEVKNRAGLSAMGQVLAYKQLYERDFKPGLPVRMGVVCEAKATDVDYLYAEHDIAVFVV